ncbi:LLM class flavin-dependent oxidoreductase [Nocardioides aestuarii]|uniref:LLM class flavin-dependent oxidoreductase n=1 Tax=Nocardioides aestuarii TaxID=252231 RepID=A0ABW4TQR0_9ACTN
MFGPWLEPWAAARSTWQSLELLGFDVAYLGDHLTHPSLQGRWIGDPYTMLAAAAQVTTELELGTLVASAAVRAPAPLARTAATLQDLSSGRFVLGVGAGVPGDEEVLLGETRTNKERFDRFVETVESLESLWSGRPLRTRAVTPLPLVPGQARPHLMISAHGPRGYDLVARCGDGWSSYGGARAASLSDEDFWDEVTRQSAAVTRACESAARDPNELRRSLLVGYGPVNPLGSEQTYLECLERAEQAGFNEVVVYWPWPDSTPGDRFWADHEVIQSAIARARDR